MRGRRGRHAWRVGFGDAGEKGDGGAAVVARVLPEALTLRMDTKVLASQQAQRALTVSTTSLSTAFGAVYGRDVSLSITEFLGARRQQMRTNL